MNIDDHIPDDKLAAGQWFDFDGGKFQIAAMGSEYDKAMTKRVRGVNAAQLKAKPEMMTDMVVEVMADTILLDWSSVKNRSEDWPATRANRVTLLKKAREFREWVSAVASDVANFRKEALEQDSSDLKSGAGVAP